MDFRHPLSSSKGLTLVETMAATVIAVLAVVGLAHSFGVGRGLIDRYLVARMAMGRATLVVDSLVTVTPRSAIVTGSQPFWYDGTQAGTTRWTVTWVDDPIDGKSVSSPSDPNPNDMKRIRVEVTWRVGSASDTLRLSRLVLSS